MGIFADRTQGRADAVVPILGSDGKRANALAVVHISPSGVEAGWESYPLVSNATLAASAQTAPVTGIRRGSYIWDAQWNGAGTLRLQVLGADGVSWRTLAELTQSGSFATPIQLGGNASVRLLNTNTGGGAAFTGLYSSIS